MKIIKKGQDFKYHVQIPDKDTGNEIQITLQNYYDVQVYTNDSRTWVDVKSCLNASNMLQFDSQFLRPLSSGQIHIKVMFSEVNPAFQDGKYDFMKIISVDSYYDAEGMIGDLDKAQWGQIYGDITQQKDLMDYLKANVSDKDIIGLTKIEYDYLKTNNNLKENNLYVIKDDND